MAPSDPDVVDRLEAAHREVTSAREAIDADPETLSTVADGYESFLDVLDRWEERATDWDDFQGYVEFRTDLSETLESIPEDIPVDDAFVDADRHVKTAGPTGSLSAGDFDAAREALAPARRYVERRRALEAATERYREAYRAARHRRADLDDRIAELRRLLEFGKADLDAPVERLREPIERYDEQIRESFASFRRESSAREFLAFVEAAAGRPMVDYKKPPEALAAYVREAPAGREPLPELRSYSEYSRSKLRHYVDDPDRLKRRVATNRTYLEGLSAEPLCVGWPPPAAAVLRYRIEELQALVARVGGEEAVAALRAVAALTRREDYERLRAAAIAHEELTDAEIRRIERGEIDEELAEAEKKRAAIVDALSEYPSPAEL